MSNDAIVHVIDDDGAVRESLAFLLGTADIEARTYESAVAFLDGLSGPVSGCVVTDLRMAGIDGLELTRRLKARDAGVPVIIVTGHGDVPLAVEAMKIGAADFLEKPFEDEALLAAVRSALNRHQAEGELEARRVEIQARLAALSPRERQVLEGVVAGRPNKTIAFDLGISPRTIEVYRANVMTKMQASSLSSLVRMTMIAKP